MSGWEILVSNSLFQVMAWSLIHFLWQGAVVAVALALTLTLIPRRFSQMRYLAAASAMALMLILPVLTGWMLWSGTSVAAPMSMGATPVEPISIQNWSTPEETGPQPGLASQTALQTRVKPWLPVVVFLWLAGVALLSLRNFGGLLGASTLSRRGTFAPPEEWEKAFRRLARRMGVTQTVRLVGSHLVSVPMVVGWLRPVVLVPAGAFTGLHPRELEAILAHELAHIRRYDYFVNLVQTFVETVLFYHPAVWWVSRQIREERENCCDDIAVASCGDVKIYAEALARMESLRVLAPDFAMGADGGSLLSRITRLVGKSSRRRRSSRWVPGVLTVIGTAALGVLILGVGAEQTGAELAKRSRPEVAAVRAQERARVRAARVATPPVPAPAPTPVPVPIPESPAPAPVPAPGYSVGVGVVPGIAPPSAPVPPAFAPIPAPAPVPPPVPVPGYSVGVGVGAATPEEAAAAINAYEAALERAGYLAAELQYSYQRAREAYVEALVAAKAEQYAEQRAQALSASSDRGWHGFSSYQGRWEASYDDGHIWIDVRWEGSRWSTSLDVAELGVSRRQVEDLLGEKTIEFEFPREAGTFLFEGEVEKRGAEASGTFRFRPDPEYVEKMEALGYDGDDVEERQMELGAHDVTTSYVRELGNTGYDDLPLHRVVEFKIHGISPEYVRGMADAGYKDLRAERIVEFKIHGISPEYVQGMAESGYDGLRAGKIVEFKIHGISPEYVQGMAQTGYGDLPAGRIVEFKIHGISADYVAGLAELGYGDIGASKVIEFKIHGVSADSIRDLQERGLTDLTPDEIIEIHIAGVDRILRKKSR